MAFESLTDRLNGVFKKLRGKGKLTEADIKAAMREVRMALLEADVNYKVAKDFCAQVSERAMGQEEDYGKEYASVKDPQNYFYLVVKGDSMEPRISDGDLALVHRQSTLENGDLGVLVYGSDGEGTLKKYIQRGNSVILHPFNPAYEELVIKGEELDHLYIAGKVVETKAKW